MQQEVVLAMLAKEPLPGLSSASQARTRPLGPARRGDERRPDLYVTLAGWRRRATSRSQGASPRRLAPNRKVYS